MKHKLILRISLGVLVVLGFSSCFNGHSQISYSSECISVVNDSLPVDSSVLDLILPYKRKVIEETERIVGYASETINKGIPESPLTNMISDLLLAKGQELASATNSPIPDMAFVNNGGLRAPLPEGAITVGDVYQLMPFENKLSLVGLNGLQMLAFLNYIASLGGEGLAGVRFTIDNSEATNIVFASQHFNVDSAKMYYVITSDYLANGGGGDVLKTASFRKDYAVLIRDVIMEYIEHQYLTGKEISPKLDGRIQLNNN